uniref:PITH domain-containing protein n=1 Tax=Zooxanthella nutricula TaxID=1333877 RepID=A0A7S2N8W2_9DINO
MMQQFQQKKAKQSTDGLKHEDVDLMMCTDLVDQSKTTALNSCSSHASLLEVLQANPDDKALASDADQQLLLKVLFKEKVNVSAVELRFDQPPPDGEEETYAKPRLVKLFTNRDMNFDDVEEVGASAQTLVETAEATKARITCGGSKFQRVESLVVFVEEAADPEASRSFINRLCIIGHQAKNYHAVYG